MSHHSSRTSVLAGFRARRAAAGRRRRLVADLSAYTSPADRAELTEILARHSDHDSAPARAALDLVHAA